jgi:hypothetical protein
MFAKQNPYCPYVTVIQDCKMKIDRIDRALVGEDTQSGLVGAVKNLESTINKRARANDEFTVKVAEKPEEIKTLLELGFEYVLQKDNLIFLRKRK